MSLDLEIVALHMDTPERFTMPSVTVLCVRNSKREWVHRILRIKVYNYAEVSAEIKLHK